MKNVLRRQLFVLNDTLINGLSIEEVDATWNDMVTLDIAKPPYPAFDVTLPAQSILHMLTEKASNLEAELKRLDAGNNFEHNGDPISISTFYGFNVTCSFTVEADGHISSTWSLEKDKLPTAPSAKQCVEDSSLEKLVYHTTIVLLATRNVIRDVKEHKMTRLGIGKSKYLSTTTLRIGEVVEREGKSLHTNTHVRPHLRRGHIRNQRYGANLSLSRQVFIEAVFVNADEGWIAERTSYSVVKSKQ